MMKSRDKKHLGEMGLVKRDIHGLEAEDGEKRLKPVKTL